MVTKKSKDRADLVWTPVYSKEYPTILPKHYVYTQYTYVYMLVALYFRHVLVIHLLKNIAYCLPPTKLHQGFLKSIRYAIHQSIN